MTINFGTVCPCFNWAKANEENCKNCMCCEGFSPDNTQTYCNYSQLPNCEPEFKKGDIAYRIVRYSILHPQVVTGKIRNSIWQRNHWEYQFGGEQHYYPAYAKKEDALKQLCEEEINNISNLLLELKQNMAECGLSLETVVPKLLEGIK